jgi:class 3 adenylate cyclase
MPKQEIVEATVSEAEDTREWAVERLKVLSRLSPWRLLRHFLSTRTAVDMDSFFDEFQCAALFIDISGFSVITEKLIGEYGLNGAEQLAEHLNTNLGEICEKLTEAGGDIIKFAGDACLCVFAVDPSLEVGSDAHSADLAQRVLLATRLSLDCIAELEAKQYEVMGTTLTAHSGIGVGPVTGFLAGGEFKRSEYALVGAPIAQLALAEPAAGNGETVVSRECWELISQWCEGEEVVSEDGSAIDGNIRVDRIADAAGAWAAPVASTMASEIEALEKEEAQLIIEEIKQVVPGQVRQKLTQFTPDSMPNVSEFRLVTVMFIRLLGIDYSKGRSELKRVQKTVHTIQTTIYEEGGAFSRFAVDDKGAVILGIFGLPPAHADDAERACRAAIRFCKQVKADTEATGRFTPTVGITTGHAFSGLVGSQRNNSRCEYTTHGPLVNLAARLMCASTDGSYVDEATKKLCEKVQSTPVDPIVSEDGEEIPAQRVGVWLAKPPINVKGKEEKVPIFVPQFNRKLTRRISVVDRSSAVGSMLQSPDGMGNHGSEGSPRAGGGGRPERSISKFAITQQMQKAKSPFPKPLIAGRKRELLQMYDAFQPYIKDDGSYTRQKLRAGMSRWPSVVLVEGGMGMGKTKLAEEAERVAEALEMMVVSSTADKLEESEMLYVFRNLMEAFLDVEEEELLRLEEDREWGSGEARMEALEQIFEEDDFDSDSDSDSDSDDEVDDTDDDSMLQYLPLLNGTVLDSVKFTPEAEAKVAAIQGKARKDKVMDLLEHWLKWLGEEHGNVCLVFEDAQYIDPISWQMIERIANLNLSIVTILCLRKGERNLSEYTTALSTQQGLCSHISLGKLDKDDVCSLLCTKWAVSTVAPEIVEVVFKKGDGSPFHSEQLADSINKPDKHGNKAWTVIKNGHCALKGGVKLQDIKFPETLHGLITAQLDLMSTEERKLLKRAAVVGMSVTPQLLAEVYNNAVVLAIEGRAATPGRDSDSVEHIRELLDRMRDKDVMHQQITGGQRWAIAQTALRKRQLLGSPPEERAQGASGKEKAANDTVYIFTQQLMQEVAEHLNLAEEKRKIHRATAEALESRDGASRKVEDAQQLAHHWGMAGPEHLKKEIEHLERAGARALAVFANKDASGVFESILAKTETVASQEDSMFQQWARDGQGKWRMQLAQAQMAMGESKPAYQTLQDAVKLYDGGIWALPQKAAMQSKIDGIMEDPTAGHVSRARREFCAELSKLHDMLSGISFHLNDSTLRQYSQLLANLFAERSGQEPEIAKGHALVTLAYSSVDEQVQAQHHCEAATAMARKMQQDDPATALNVFMLTSLYAADRGSWQPAAMGWDMMAKLAARMGDADKCDTARLQLAWSQYNLGELDNARRSCKRAEASAEKRGDSFMRCRCLVLMAHCCLAIGEAEKARKAAQHSRELLTGLIDGRGAGGVATAQLDGAEIQQYGLDALLLLRGMEHEAAYAVALQGSKKISTHRARNAGKQTQSAAIIGCVYIIHYALYIILHSPRLPGACHRSTYVREHVVRELCCVTHE